MSSNNTYKENAQKKLNNIIGLKCWAVLSGYPNGGIINLHFGKKIKRSRLIKNKKLPAELQKYKGEYRICIKCNWRLQSSNKIITGSSEPNCKNGPLEQGFSEILNEEVTQVFLTDSFGDLEILFGSMKLKAFCNYTGNADNDYFYQEDSNWYLFHKNIKELEVLQGCKIVMS